jgi:hypothetical protein
MQTRRTFIQIMPVAGAALLASQKALAARPADAMDPKAAQAVALKYVEKTPDAGKKCNNCQLYQAKATDEWGACPLFGGKKVAGAGWCSAWVKKA